MSLSCELGKGSGCSGCVNRHPKPKLLTNSYCDKVALDHNAKPDFTGLTGDRSTCSAFVPDVPTSIRFVVANGRMIVRDFVSAVPLV